MATERAVSRAELIKFTEAFRLETKDLADKMSALQVELAESRGQSVPARIVGLEERIRQLENSKAMIWGAMALITFVGAPGIAFLIVHLSK